MSVAEQDINFLIPGTMKSGTSSIAFHLRKHPSIGIPQNELHFFDLKYEEGIQWYLDLFTPMRSKGAQILGEKTPAYCRKELYAQRIHEFNPDIKLIWVFRNPVDRAFSHYLHKIKTGAEIYSFAKALKLEEKRIARPDNAAINLGYKEGGLYAKQVQSYLKYFPKEQMQFILFEDFKREPDATIHRILDFLEVDKSSYQYEHAVKNKTVIPKMPSLLFMTRKYFGRESKPYYFARYVNYKLLAPTDQKPAMDPKVRAELIAFFQPYNEALAELTGLNTQVWQ